MMATRTPQHTSKMRDVNMSSGEPVCGTSRMMVAVIPAKRPADARLTAQHARIESTMAIA